jgi:tRNA(Ile)-lysidine synthase
MTRHGGGEGYLTLPRDAPAAHVAAACLCAAGTAQPPRGERLRRLVDRIRAGETFTATLAGARIEAAGDTGAFFREPGEARRQALPPLRIVARTGGGVILTPDSPLRRLRRCPSSPIPIGPSSGTVATN